MMTAIRNLEGVVIQKNGVAVMTSPEQISIAAGSSFDVTVNADGVTCDVSIPPAQAILAYMSGVSTVAFNVTRYVILNYTIAPQTTDLIRLKMQGTGNISKFYVTLGTNTLSGSVVFTLLKNGNPTAITVTIASGILLGSDIANVVSYVDGDAFSVQIVTANGSGSITNFTVTALHTILT